MDTILKLTKGKYYLKNKNKMYLLNQFQFQNGGLIKKTNKISFRMIFKELKINIQELSLCNKGKKK
jgi:hypothetical protein